MVMSTLPGQATGINALRGLGQYVEQQRLQSQQQQQMQQQQQQMQQAQDMLVQGLQTDDMNLINQVAVQYPDLVKTVMGLQPDQQGAAQDKPFQMGTGSMAGYVFDPNTGEFTKKVEPPKDQGAELRSREIALREQAAELKKLEVKEKVLDRQLQRETNDLKKQELEQKLIKTKQDKDKRQSDLTLEGENALADADLALQVLNDLQTMEGLEAAVGGSSVFPTLPGGDAANFEAKLEQFQSLQFLTSVQKMKGLGALSENEGKKLSSAAGALSLSMSEDAFKKELKTIETILTKARARLAKKYGVSQPEETKSSESESVISWSDL